MRRWTGSPRAAGRHRSTPRHLREHTLVLYDLTTSYDGRHPLPVGRRGHQPGTARRVRCRSSSGCCARPKVVRSRSRFFEGSTNDPKTVASQVDKLRTCFGLQRSSRQPISVYPKRRFATLPRSGSAHRPKDSAGSAPRTNADSARPTRTSAAASPIASIARCAARAARSTSPAAGYTDAEKQRIATAHGPAPARAAPDCPPMSYRSLRPPCSS